MIFDMIIQNFEELAITEKKKDCLEILESGLEAANPENIISNYVTSKEIKIDGKIFNISKYSNIYTVAFGKAADSMTRAINSIISVRSGIIVIPKGTKAKITRLAKGVPVGGEIEFLDDGTLFSAFKNRAPVASD